MSELGSANKVPLVCAVEELVVCDRSVGRGADHLLVSTAWALSRLALEFEVLAHAGQAVTGRPWNLP